jgi:CBS domain-containing protein
MADIRPKRTDDPRSQSAPRTPGEDDRTNQPPEASATNRDHPGQVGDRITTPGAGIGSSGAQSRSEQGGLGHDTRPSAPGAERPGSTDTGPFARPSEQPDPRTAPANREFESPSRSGMAPLSVPDRDDRDAPPGSAGAAAAEVADPNYSAANRSAEIDPGSPGYTRMDYANRGGARQTTQYNRHGRQVRDIMTADVNVATPQTELYYVARMMDERDVGIIPIVESTESMKLVGLVTDRDIVVRTIAKRTDPNDLRAADVMSAGVESVSPDTSIEELIQKMEQRQVRRMPVIDNDRLVGIVAQADIARRGADPQTGDLVERISEP